MSISCGFIPSAWKKSIVVAIYKKGDRGDPKNYSPVSLTPITCKLMEGIVNDKIRSYLHDCKFNFDEQFAFLPRKSTNLQLLRFYNIIAGNAAEGFQVDAVYLDFAKAFDSVVHSKLLYKMEIYGISGMLLKWLKSFLSGRLQSE